MANTPNYEIDPNDSRITAVKDEGMKELSDHDKMANEIKGNTDKYFDGLKEGIADYKDEQTKLQNEQTALTIQGIEQNKADTKKDYLKEQSGAYVDWQKQSNEYGAKSEQMAASGLANTGYSESSQVSMYNQYQNRVAVARESYNRAVVAYDQKIAEAKLQNSSMLAEIAFNALQQELQLSLQQTQYNNQLLQELSSQRNAIKQSIWNRYQNVIDNINAENALKEQARVHDAQIANTEASTALAKLQAKKLQMEIDAARDASVGGGGNTSPSGSRVAKGQGGTAKSTTKAGNAKIQQTANKGVQLDNTQKSKYDYSTLTKLGLAGASASKVSDLVDKGVLEEYKTSGGSIGWRYTTKGLNLNYQAKRIGTKVGNEIGTAIAPTVKSAKENLNKTGTGVVKKVTDWIAGLW